jgi:hypothetical protein
MTRVSSSSVLIYNSDVFPPNPSQVVSVEVNSAQQQQQDADQPKKSSWSSIRSAVVKSASIPHAARALQRLHCFIFSVPAGPANTRYLFAFPAKSDMDKWMMLLAQSQGVHPSDSSRGKLLSTLSHPPSLMSPAVDASTAENSPAMTYVGSVLWMLGRCAAYSQQSRPCCFVTFDCAVSASSGSGAASSWSLNVCFTTQTSKPCCLTSSRWALLFYASVASAN